MYFCCIFLSICFFFIYEANNLLKFPHVIVDVGVDQVTGQYNSLVEYSCLNAGVTSVQEIRIATRETKVDKTYLNRLEQILRDSGIDFDKLNIVEHKDSCKYKC